MQHHQSPGQPQTCTLCKTHALPSQVSRVRSNVRRFQMRQFGIWRCAACASLHCEPVAELSAFYDGYPIRQQTLGYFERAWYGVVLRRLQAAGLRPEHRMLDFGCNQGLFIAYLRERGYPHCAGYDPYVERFADEAALAQRYDAVVSLDVIEHDSDPIALMKRLAALAEDGGLVCIETPNAEGIDLDRPEAYLHALHLPYHVHILSQRALSDLGRSAGLRPQATYTRWYMDHWWPATSRRLIEGLLQAGDNNVDAGYEPPRLGLFLRRPALLFHLLFGYVLPEKKTDHMMMLFRRVRHDA